MDHDGSTILYYDGEALVFRTGEFNEDLVEDLKDQIPPHDREWDGEYWRIDPQHGDLIVDLVSAWLGEEVILPEIPEEAPWDLDLFS